MAQTLRPDSTVSVTNVTGGFADIDETSPNDADYIWSTNDTIGTAFFGLSNPSGTNLGGASTVRYRIAKMNGGVVQGTGATVNVTAYLYESGVLRDTAPARGATGTWTTWTWNPDTSAVSNWSNLRLSFIFSKSGATNPRGAAVSWAEMEVPWAISSAGSTSFGFSTAGKLTGTVRKTGTTTLTFTETANLNVIRYGVGSTTLTFTASGNATPPGDIFGSTTLGFTPTGAIIGQAPILGTTSLAFDTTAFATMTKLAYGTTTLTFRVRADLNRYWRFTPDTAPIDWSNTPDSTPSEWLLEA